MSEPLPVGKVPPPLLAKLLARGRIRDSRVRVGPGIGMDCAVVEQGERYFVYKSDPITFATDEIGYYAVHINANDIATTGAVPRWMLVTLLLPADGATPEFVERLFDQIYGACDSLGIDVIGGHSEITHGLERLLVACTMIGEVAPDRLVTPQGAQPGDRLLLTKGVPIETTCILAREFPEQAGAVLDEQELEQARNFLHRPGIGVLADAQTALGAGRVTAMHDPTEGGLLTALWELAEASGRTLEVDLEKVTIPELSARLCRQFGLDPLGSIASGALLLAVASDDAEAVREALVNEGIACSDIGEVQGTGARVLRRTRAGVEAIGIPSRDAIARAYEQ